MRAHAINGVVIDAETEPLVLIFKNDEERLMVIRHLESMPEREGPRAYGMFPDSVVNTKWKEDFLDEALAYG